MGSSSPGGNYSLLSSVNYPTNLHSISAGSIASNIQFYYIQIPSSCAQDVISSDTLVAITFNINSYNISCWDDLDGRIVVDLQTNTIVPFTYILDSVPNSNPFPGDSVFDGLGAGTYHLTITDSASCYIDKEIHITAPGSPLQALTSDTSSTCHQDSSGFAVVPAVGGTGPYTYVWSNSGGIVSYDDTATSLLGGLYFVEVTDLNGCDTVGSVQILTPNTAVFSTTQIGEVVCKGDASGFIVGDAGGGFAPYMYEWSTSLNGVIQTTYGSYNTDTLHNVSSGIYLLDIMDHYGCKVSQSSITVNEPLTALVIDTLYLIDSVYCYGDNDGISLAQVSGGDPSYTYLWDNGEATLLANGLTGGYHLFSVVDERGCEEVDSIYIPESSEIVSTLVVEESIICYDGLNGVVSVSTQGGYSDYIYSWSNGQMDTGLVAIIFNLSYGVYALTTEDSLGCSVVDSIYLSEPNLLIMEAHELEWISCNGLLDGLASASAQGGTPPYTFVWDGNQIGDTVNTLSEGAHTVVVTDARGCSATDTVKTHEPSPLTVNINILDSVYCNGVNTGMLEAVANGGTPFTTTSYAYTYLWDDALQASQTTAIAINLLADIYTVIVTDYRGCIASASSDITAVTNTMTLDTNFTNVSCYGEVDGTASVVALGGHPPYAYDWVGPSGTSLSAQNAISSLSAGTYSVTVSDTNNCTRNTSVDVVEPLAIVYNVSTQTFDETCLGACNGGILLTSLTGGTAPYFANLTNNITGITTPHVVSSTHDSILGVCEGSYTVEFTDVRGCSSDSLPAGNNQAQVGVSVSLPTPVITLVNHALCYGGSSGSLAVFATNPSYTYIWEDVNTPGITIGSGSVINNLSVGDYIVLLQYTDPLGNIIPGCNVSSLTHPITDPPVITITETTHADVLCNGESTGALSVLVGGGTPGTPSYTYNWTPSQSTNATINNLPAGSYSLSITDANSCIQTDIFTINEPTALIASISQGTNPYVLIADPPIGGIPPYTYGWVGPNPTSQSQSSTTYNVYVSGTYYVVVTDSNGCESQSNSETLTASWDCDPIHGCVDTTGGDGSGAYPTLSACELACLSTGVEDLTTQIALNIYPNPFNQETTVDFGRIVKQATIRVIDVYGKLIEVYQLKDQDNYIIKRTNKASGVYFMEVYIEGGIIKEKLIVE